MISYKEYILKPITKKDIFWARVFSIIFMFIFVYVLAFSFENLIEMFYKFFKLKQFNIRLTAYTNSHFGSISLSLIIVIVIPFYFKLAEFLSNKFKIFRSIYIWGLIGFIFCYSGEFLIGLLYNKVLTPCFFESPIWDYSWMEIKINSIIIPLHLYGQINLLYAPAWFITGMWVFIIFQIFYGKDIELGIKIIRNIKYIFIALIKNKGVLEKEFFKTISEDVLNKEKDLTKL